MKCEIIKDLLPSYMDGLTSNESNEAVETHSDTCEKCKQVLCQMQKEIPNLDINVEKEIKPLKKLKKKRVKSVLISIAITLVVFGAFMYATCYGWKVDCDEVEVSYSYDKYSVMIDFEYKGRMNLNVIRNSNLGSMEFRKVLQIIPDKDKIDMRYAVTYRESNGRVNTELPSIIVEYADGAVEYDFSEIARELGVYEKNVIMLVL